MHFSKYNIFKIKYIIKYQQNTRTCFPTFLIKYINIKYAIMSTNYNQKPLYGIIKRKILKLQIHYS